MKSKSASKEAYNDEGNKKHNKHFYEEVIMNVRVEEIKEASTGAINQQEQLLLETYRRLNAEKQEVSRDAKNEKNKSY